MLAPEINEFDPHRLEILWELSVASNTPLLDELIASFATDTPARLAEARGRTVATELASSMHFLRGRALNLGLTTVASLAGTLERQAAHLDPAEIERGLSELARAATRGVDYLESWTRSRRTAPSV